MAAKKPPHGPGRRKGNHALRKRCPGCKKLRRFYEPPGDVGDRSPKAEARYTAGIPSANQRKPRVGWQKIDDQWICGHCIRRPSQWVVEKFDQNTLVGVVKLGSKNFKFHSTSFQSNTGFRFPRQGETVEVVTNSAGDLLSVHGK